MRILWFLVLTFGFEILSDNGMATTIQTLQSTIQAPTTLPATVTAQLPINEQQIASALDTRSESVEAAKQALNNAQTSQEISVAQQQLLTAQQTPTAVTQAIANKVDQLSPAEQEAYAQAQAELGSN